MRYFGFTNCILLVGNGHIEGLEKRFKTLNLNVSKDDFNSKYYTVTFHINPQSLFIKFNQFLIENGSPFTLFSSTSYKENIRQLNRELLSLKLSSNVF